MVPFVATVQTQSRNCSVCPDTPPQQDEYPSSKWIYLSVTVIVRKTPILISEYDTFTSASIFNINVQYSKIFVKAKFVVWRYSCSFIFLPKWLNQRTNAFFSFYRNRRKCLCSFQLNLVCSANLIG